MGEKLFLLDGMALVYRAYFAFNQSPRVTSYGLNTSAIFGFCNTLLEVIQKERPTQLAVAFDTAAPTERHQEFESYKAHREAMPEDLSRSLPYIDRLLEAMNIKVLKMDGFEADDVIGTLAVQAEKQGWQIFMMTTDKDFGQLVTPQIKIYKPSSKGGVAEVLGVEEIKSKWNIKEVSQVIDILGLWGDASDNIPGVPGVGEKTAKILIEKYGSMENIYEHLDELKGKQKENFEQFRDQAFLSKKLATINLNVPVQLSDYNFTLQPYNAELLESLLVELEFRTLLAKMLGNKVESSSGVTKKAPVAVQVDLFGNALNNTSFKASDNVELSAAYAYKTIADSPHQYILANTIELRKDLYNELKSSTQFSFDTETTGIEPMWAEVVGISFSTRQGYAYYIPLGENKKETTQVLHEFYDLFNDEKILKIGQNIKYDIIILGHYGIHVKGPLYDTMLGHYLAEPDMRHNMDFLSMTYLGYKPVSITELIGKKGSGQENMRNVSISLVSDYACEDADITLQLYDPISALTQSPNIKKVLNEIELPLVHVLAEMERNGVKIDRSFLENYSSELDLKIKEAEKNIYDEAGIQFNINSPRQLGELLFDHLKLEPKPKRTATGQYKTDEEVLLGLQHFPIVSNMLRYRQLAKLKSTYVDALPKMIHPVTGRIHTSFNQAVAATGRLSSDRPNLQNIPIRTEEGREIRKAFIPESASCVLLSADYSQIELRIIAAMSHEINMMEAFIQGHDIHQATAARIYNISYDQVDKNQRRTAKSVNFGIIYGISAFGLSQNLGIPRREAAEIIESYFATYPGIKTYMDKTIEFARKNGYVETIMGRRRYIRDINSANANIRGFAERNAINAPIQGSAADMIKMAMIKIYNTIKSKQLRSKMILQVHDELVFEVPESELDYMKKMVPEEMSKAISLEVPIIAEVGIGKNWLEAH